MTENNNICISQKELTDKVKPACVPGGGKLVDKEISQMNSCVNNINL